MLLWFTRIITEDELLPPKTILGLYIFAFVASAIVTLIHMVT